MSYLVTGGAGFVGSHVVDHLLARGDEVIVIDDFNGYYSPEIKRRNLEEVRTARPAASLEVIEGNIRDRQLLQHLFAEHKLSAVLHLAAMPGVRASIARPDVYFDVNLGGTVALLDEMVQGVSGPLPIFVFASTSSVYGATDKIPFTETDPCDRPLVPYSASKRAAELAGFAFHHLHGVDFTVLRLFTVYGPRNRPDMMAGRLVDSLESGASVPLNEGGRMRRDWTFVDDIVGGIIAAADRRLGYEVINLARGEPVELGRFVTLIEQAFGKSANLQDAPMPKGDVLATHADITKARNLLGYVPKISVEEGVARYIEWRKLISEG